MFRKGDRVRTYRPTNKWQEKAIRGVMARHGWRLVPGLEGAGVGLAAEGASKALRMGARHAAPATEAPPKGLRAAAPEPAPANAYGVPDRSAAAAPRGAAHDA